MFKLILRIAVRVLLPLALLAILMVAVVAGGVFFYTSDLPDTQAMNSFAPVAPTTILDTNICGEKAIVKALPTSQMMDIRNALRAAEGDGMKEACCGVFMKRFSVARKSINTMEPILCKYL